MAMADLGADLDAMGKVYGEDYAFLGYVPGIETAIVAWAEDPRITTPVDYYGNSIDDLGVMDGINKIDDFDLVMIATGGSSRWDPMMRQWAGTYFETVDFWAMGQTSQRITYWPYYQAGMVKGLLATLEAARYEGLLGSPGLLTAYLDGSTLICYGSFILIIVGNVIFFLKRSGGKKE
jgi:hypothetical protein